MQLPRLREWRERRDFTQRRLAAESGVSERSIAGYEAGASARGRSAHKLATVLEVAPEDLTDEQGEEELGRLETRQSEVARAMAMEAGEFGEYLDGLGLDELQRLHRRLMEYPETNNARRAERSVMTALSIAARQGNEFERVEFARARDALTHAS